jgi:hypothetical protein
MKQIPLRGKWGNGKFAIVDDADYEMLVTFFWRGHKDGYPRTSVYLGRYNGKDVTRTYRIHQLIMPRLARIDHKNGNKLDNQRKNLREASAGQNSMNRKGSSKKWDFKGIDRSIDHPRRKQWRAVIRTKGKIKRSKYFSTPDEAAHEYDRLALKEFGGFARLNFSDYDS